MATTVAQAQRAVYDVACKMVNAEPLLSERSITYTAISAAKIVVGYNGGTMFPIATMSMVYKGSIPRLQSWTRLAFNHWSRGLRWFSPPASALHRWSSASEHQG